MAHTSHKDLLLTRLQEFDTAQQMADEGRSKMDRARSEMHCIIGSLPSGAKPDVGIALMPRRDRPVITAAIPQQDVGEVTPVAPSVSKPAARRMSPLEKKAAVQEAILFHAQHPHLPLKQVAVQHGLEPKALSRPYAKKLLQAMPPDRDRTPKDQAEDFLYNEKRRK